MWDSLNYKCECGIELQTHNTIMIKEHMDEKFKHLKCKKCDSENYTVIKKGSLVIITHCGDCGIDSPHFWFGVVQ